MSERKKRPENIDWVKMTRRKRKVSEGRQLVTIEETPNQHNKKYKAESRETIVWSEQF